MEDRDDYPIIPQPENKNKEFLDWIYERMIYVHGEKDLYDYMINFKSIIDSQVAIQNELISLREQNEILRQSYKYIHESRSKAAAELNEVEKKLASLKEVVKELIPIAETLKMYYASQPIHDRSGLQPFKGQVSKIESIIDQAKRISDNK